MRSSQKEIDIQKRPLYQTRLDLSQSKFINSSINIQLAHNTNDVYMLSPSEEQSHQQYIDLAYRPGPPFPQSFSSGKKGGQRSKSGK